METTQSETYVYDEGTSRIVEKEIDLVPGLYKLIDEGCVNCRDHAVRCAEECDDGEPGASRVTQIRVDVDGGLVTMYNDGTGIDVEKHPEHGVWIPELIFGHLRTSTNYDKSKKRIVGGKNGFGFKLVLIWSKWGRVETVDSKRKLKFEQEYENNLDIIGEPKVTKCTRKSYTEVKFRPDFERMGLSGFTPDMLSLIHRRVLDLGAVTAKTVKVSFNGNVTPVKQLSQYVDMYLGGKGDAPRVHESPNGRWEYLIGIAPKQEFTQISFVNGIFTGKGGRHVDYIVNQITRKAAAAILKKRKVVVKPAAIKEQLIVFLRCDIDNPSFDSQTKDHMTTSVAKFGSTCEVSDKLVDKLCSMGVADAACAIADVKAAKAVKKTESGQRRSIRGIPKLIDANVAGTKRSGECVLLLCEGDSAKAGIVSGLSKTDRDIIGVYPLKGKLFNARGETATKVAGNKEIYEIKQILGLEAGESYDQDSIKSKLRYGKVWFMTDQDLDGSHIKGLVVNLFDSHWPTLSALPGFLGFMHTPILKARKGSSTECFYTEQEYTEWKNRTPDADKWQVKYYKGLGTSTGAEFKEYFRDRRVVNFRCEGDQCRAAVDMVFNKKRSADRKEWLGAYDSTCHLDSTADSVSYAEFVNKELIHFSKHDCERSIPNVMDGLKTSLRKILFTCFKRNLTKEIKVAQLSGSVSEMSAYHHGEASLNGGIVHMAQDFVGSNNLNLLMPNGQFGTRLEGGADSASERYIFTQLSPLARKAFPEADDCVLDYLVDDGKTVEPRFYAPVVPMVLVNGTRGIGTGFSTFIPQFNPIDVVKVVRSLVSNGKCDTELVPWYRGFRGDVVPKGAGKYEIIGKWDRLTVTQLRIWELPVGFWTSAFKEHIECLMSEKDDPIVRDIKDNSTEKLVDFLITFRAGYLESAAHTDVVALLKLSTTVSLNNMHLFDADERLRKYATPMEIAEYFVEQRGRIYDARYASVSRTLTEKAAALTDRAKFIRMVVSGDLELRGVPKQDLENTMAEHGFRKESDSYKHLTNLPLHSLTLEESQRLEREQEKCLQELEQWEQLTPTDLWIADLDALQHEYELNLQGYTESKSSTRSVKKLKTRGA